jgi:hypothetical protein
MTAAFNRGVGSVKTRNLPSEGVFRKSDVRPAPVCEQLSYAAYHLPPPLTPVSRASANSRANARWRAQAGSGRGLCAALDPDGTYAHATTARIARVGHGSDCASERDGHSEARSLAESSRGREIAASRASLSGPRSTTAPRYAPNAGTECEPARGFSTRRQWRPREPSDAGLESRRGIGRELRERARRVRRGRRIRARRKVIAS